MANYQDFISATLEENQKKIKRSKESTFAGINGDNRPIVANLSALSISPENEGTFTLPSALYRETAGGLSSRIVDDALPFLMSGFKFKEVNGTPIAELRLINSKPKLIEENKRKNFDNFEKKLFCGGFNHLFDFSKPDLIVMIVFSVALFFDKSYTRVEDVFDEETNTILQKPTNVVDKAEAYFGYYHPDDSNVLGKILHEGTMIDFDFHTNMSAI